MSYARFPHILLSCILTLLAGAVGAVAQFSNPNFVIETIYEGNGTISLDFDPVGRLYVAEKQGRVLLFEPSDAPQMSIAYQYYEGDWNQLPDFDSLTPAATGTATGFNLDARLRDDQFGFRYTATLEITTADTYTFYTGSDDGSRLLIDGLEVVDNDGAHGHVYQSGNIYLGVGSYTLVVEYFEAGGGESLDVEWESSTLPRQALGGAGGDFTPPVVVVDITSAVDTNGERGLLGMRLDPDFANNRYMYLFYSTASDQRLSRVTLNSTFTAVEAGSENILLSGLPNASNVHNAGDMHFHPDDPYSLYIVLGDDGNRYVVDDLDVYNGKLLRVDAATGLGLPGNPFWNGDADSVRSRIWAHSFRNPFRFFFDPDAPVSDALYISENGDGTDRLAQIEIGADGGWPSDFEDSSVDGKRTILRTSSPSVTAGIIIRGGPFAPDGPVIYQARYGQEIRRWNLVGSDLDQIEAIPEDNGGAFLLNPPASMVSFELGPDGALYFTDSNQGDSLGSGYKVGRIRYQGGEAPVADFASSPVSGEAPLVVTFTDASSAPDSSIVSWAWDFGDGSTSTQPSPQHAFNDPGHYTVSLTIVNASGLSATSSQEVTVYRTTTMSLSGSMQDVSSGSGLAVSTPLTLSFYQADGMSPAPVSGGSGEGLNQLTAPAGTSLDLSFDVELTSAGLVVVVDDGAGGLAAKTGGYLVDLDNGSTLSMELNLSETAIAGRALDTLGRPASTDVGLYRAEGMLPFAIVGGRDIQADTPGIPTGVLHRLDTDELGFFYFPMATEDAGTFRMNAPGDTGAAVYGPVSAEVVVAGQSLSMLNLVLGLYDGGVGVADLSGIPETLDVDFITQIQPIFTANCIGCHNDIATNSGGLDLQAEASFAELVDRYSVEATGVKLVEPGHPERSYLMEKINSLTPQVGTNMRPSDPMPLADRALIRDWISQLSAYGLWREAVFAENATLPSADPGADFNGNGLPNAVEFLLGLDPALPGSPTLQPRLLRDGSGLDFAMPVPRNDTGFTMEWSPDLSPGSWQTIVSRERFGAWVAEDGIDLLHQGEEGQLLFRLPSPDENAQGFYRLRTDVGQSEAEAL